MGSTFYSTVSTALKRRYLLQGTVIAGAGSFLLLVGGAFMPLWMLSRWGWIILITSFGLITLGLLPYRRLCRLEARPHSLVQVEDGTLEYFHYGKQRITLPANVVKKLSFLESGDLYGLGVWLEERSGIIPIVHDPLFNVGRHRRKLKKKFNCDLFFPFFSERTVQQLQIEFN